MEIALRAKFGIEEFKQFLLSTRDCDIVEHTRRDNFWADGGGGGKGKNELGKLLMRLR